MPLLSNFGKVMQARGPSRFYMDDAEYERKTGAKRKRGVGILNKRAAELLGMGVKRVGNAFDEVYSAVRVHSKPACPRAAARSLDGESHRGGTV